MNMVVDNGVPRYLDCHIDSLGAEYEYCIALCEVVQCASAGGM
jgi:hypothetical protein